MFESQPSHMQGQLLTARQSQPVGPDAIRARRAGMTRPLLGGKPRTQNSRNIRMRWSRRIGCRSRQMSVLSMAITLVKQALEPFLQNGHVAVAALPVD
jgi:hypothetical protein